MRNPGSGVLRLLDIDKPLEVTEEPRTEKVLRLRTMIFSGGGVGKEL